MSSRVRRKVTPVSRNERKIISAYNPDPPVKNRSFVSYEATNDKNFVPKQPRKIDWTSSGPSQGGISWNDADKKSPITGMNLWMDGHLLGIQFLHTMG